MRKNEYIEERGCALKRCIPVSFSHYGSRQVVFLLFLPLLFLSACRKEATDTPATGMCYATLLTIDEKDDYTLVKIADPWQEGLLATYVLIEKGRPRPDSLPEGTVVRVPIERAAVFSCVHATLIGDLGATKRISGLCDVDYLLSPTLKAEIENGRMHDFGLSLSPDLETLAAAHIDALLISPFENAGYGALPTLRVPIILCADYMEESALGRAEWMKFYARLFGAAPDSLFATIEESYFRLATLVQADTHPAPTVLCDMKQGSAWYVPGGRSYLATLFRDAGAQYIFAERKERGSIGLSPEVVLAEGASADKWIVKYGASHPLTLQGLADDMPACKLLHAWQSGEVYGCNTMKVAYYEDTPFHPERLLRDYILIFRPWLLPGDTLRYFRRLAP